ncbi:hypothetical protein CAPTEDRAFT_155655 [Capitella teleta]|uniref:Uncharacterized protein n=1 Tax=Capitella teleta TaxID=283909 RepID=R7VJR7_CAPTE|nr:hypothetical protein CAPTEDRAFT_155655 [Capitella teleta]|eukprot:ELU16706.1 hypothetical protein CAPTEDRAFT_155655 [Capitella teleta]
MAATCTKSPLSTHDKEVLDRIFNPDLPFADIAGDKQDVPETEEQDTAAVLEAKQLEAEAVEKAEKGDVKGALELFSKAIDVAPERASGFNNRAQAKRLLGDVEGALEDLNSAIRVSEGEGKAACQAFTQRALIHRLKGEDEAALEDFKKASSLGSDFAKAQVIAMNPYAAMCNAMMREMVAKTRKGEM